VLAREPGRLADAPKPSIDSSSSRDMDQDSSGGRSGGFAFGFGCLVRFFATLEAAVVAEPLAAGFSAHARAEDDPAAITGFREKVHHDLQSI
jgi:hypothetical protein